MTEAVAALPEIHHRFVQANGLQFHVAECGEGEKFALCLHGFPESGYSWRHQLPLLAERGYRVWAPDLRGYGQTDKPKGVAAYDLEILMQDVVSLIDASGAKQTLLLFHDWGGVIGWHVVVRQLRPLEGAICMNIPHPGAMQANMSFRRLRQFWYCFFFQLPWLPEFLLTAKHGAMVARAFRDTSCHPERWTEEDLAVYREDVCRPGAATAMLDYYRALFRTPGARRQRKQGYPAVDTRTLMLWGERDIALTKQLSYGTEKFVPNLTLHYLPDVSHWTQQDDPETVNRHIEDWLAAGG